MFSQKISLVRRGFRLDYLLSGHHLVLGCFIAYENEYINNLNLSSPPLQPIIYYKDAYKI